MAGSKHKFKYTIGDRINNSFTILREYRQPTNQITHPYDWMVECKCDCGNIFHCRQYKLESRLGCISCTASKSLSKRSKIKTGIENHGLKLRKYREYQKGAKLRNLTFDLSFEEFLNISSKDCIYCGANPSAYPGDAAYLAKFANPWLRNGIDRIDSSKGYSADNCAPCCAKCNYAKHDLSVDDFKNHIEKIYKHLFLESSTTIPAGSTSEANADGNGELLNKDEDIV